jgi:hypothetical protein
LLAKDCVAIRSIVAPHVGHGGVSPIKFSGTNKIHLGADAACHAING